MKKTKRADFHKPYRYLRDRMAYMNYAHYRSVGVPLGSGVTEVACKTLYAQRLKLSGMRWTKAGAQTILNLRVLQQSGVWDDAYARLLQQYEQAEFRGRTVSQGFSGNKAALVAQPMESFRQLFRRARQERLRQGSSTLAVTGGTEPRLAFQLFDALLGPLQLPLQHTDDVNRSTSIRPACTSCWSCSTPSMPPG